MKNGTIYWRKIIVGMGMAPPPVMGTIVIKIPYKIESVVSSDFTIRQNHFILLAIRNKLNRLGLLTVYNDSLALNGWMAGYFWAYYEIEKLSEYEFEKYSKWYKCFKEKNEIWRIKS